MITRCPLIALVLLAASCNAADAPPDGAAAECRPADARRVVEHFGTRLRNVSLLAPDSVLEREMRASYEPLVELQLVRSWLSDPLQAPGRRVSSPWPQRIEIGAIVVNEAGECIVDADVVHVVNPDTATAVSRERVSLTVSADGARIIAYHAAGRTTTDAGVMPADAPGVAGPDSTPAAVIRAYFDAIRAGDYRRAYAYWGNGGDASGQGYEAFAAGFAETASVRVEVGRAGRVEGAAGSRFVELPVIVHATTRAGTRQIFEGTYTLRRSVVDGATAEQRRWHIYSADIAER
ncbi:MAG TPA: hypothetical protein VFZ24_00710 [Longimicrobiales bacterium]